MPSTRHPDLAVTQNFLRSGHLIDRLLRQSGIGHDDLVVEIGPGTGIITERLAAACRQVLAVEKDPGLAHGLRRRLAHIDNVALFESDVLAFPMPISAYKVFASIPFNVTAGIVSQITDQATAPDDAFLVMQAEAAARFLGLPRESLASLRLKPWFEPMIVHRFRRHDFAPAPRVDVVMLRLKKRGPPLVPAGQRQAYRDFVTAVSTSWQPTVRVSLAVLLGSATARTMTQTTGLNLSLAPMDLAFAGWLELFAAYWQLRESDSRTKADAIAGAEERLRQQQHRLQKVHRTRTRPRPN